MEQLIIEVNNRKNVSILSELLKKFDFITNIEKLKPIKKTRKNNMPIEWGKEKC